jgi:signal transduction histidine kinase
MPRAAIWLAVVLAIGAALPFSSPFALVALVPLWFLAREAGARAAAAGAVAVVAVEVAHALAWDLDLPFAAVAAVSALAATAATLGLYAGARRSHAARERELLAAQAVADERLRIARELHDAVGHEVSLMVVQLQALGLTAQDDAVRESTDAIAGHGRRAMAEMHRTLALLRDAGEPAEREPSPGLEGLDDVVQRARASGLSVSLTVEGAPRPLSPALELSAYRIVQEAMTNAVRHAGRAAAQVTLRYEPSALAIAVVDDGDGSPAGPEAGGGHGLTGMRERVALFGGDFRAGQRPGGGFEVHASLPYGT